MRIPQIITDIPAYFSRKKPDSKPPELSPEIHGGRVYKDYYIRTKYDPAFKALIDDYYANQWSEDKFNWGQDIRQNLVDWNDRLPHDELLRVARNCIPLVSDYPKDKKEKLMTEGLPPPNSPDLAELKATMVNRQYKALQQISRHMGAVEQVAVAPLDLIPIVLRRHREAQEAGQLIAADECRHGRIAVRYLEEKVGGEIYIHEDMVDEMERFLRWGKYVPGTSVFAAVLIETVGNSYFRFFAKRVPEPLLSDICSTITTFDETRHINICLRLYEMLHDPDKKSWLGGIVEQFRNEGGIKAMGKMLYGEHAKPDHYLMQALTAFGMSRKELFDSIQEDLTEKLGQIKVKINPSLFPMFHKIAGL